MDPSTALYISRFDPICFSNTINSVIPVQLLLMHMWFVFLQLGKQNLLHRDFSHSTLGLVDFVSINIHIIPRFPDSSERRFRLTCVCPQGWCVQLKTSSVCPLFQCNPPSVNQFLHSCLAHGLFSFLVLFSLSLLITLSLQDLMEQLEKQDKTVRKLKKQLKVFAKKIGELEGNAEGSVLTGPVFWYKSVSAQLCPPSQVEFSRVWF